VDDDRWSDAVLVGRVVRPQGNRGEVIVAPETDFGSTRFAIGATFTTRIGDRLQTLQVAGSREHRGRWVIGFAGISTIDDAEAMRGAELRIAPEALAPLPDGAFYVHELIGCRVETSAGQPVGSVARVDMAGTPLLVVGDEPDEVLIPLAETICRRVDVRAGIIVIDPPEGLIELNVTGKARP
jgi:16S rRNA processing protein RimM